SLDWTESVGYAYGAELVHALLRVKRSGVYACIVGDGSGRPRLQPVGGEQLGRRILLTGRVPAEAVSDYLAAFDVASLSQSVDGVGACRYSTKHTEDLGADL